MFPRSLLHPTEGRSAGRKAILFACRPTGGPAALEHVTAGPNLPEEVLGELAGPDLDLVGQGSGTASALGGFSTDGVWPH